MNGKIQRACRAAFEQLEERRLLATLYVDAGLATGAQDGSSWANAWQDLQQALSAATAGDKILVAGGTYKPTSGTDRTISFVLKSGVEIDGGYAGSANTSNPDIRDISAYSSILSGDIGAAGDSSDNSCHVVVGGGTDTTAILDGFVVTGGNTSGSADLYGGGIYNSAGSPTIRNCIVIANTAHSGGGMYNYSCSPMLTGCTFEDNSAYAGGGGGMYNYLSAPTLAGCTFDHNTATEGGGAMYNSQSTLVISNGNFTGNAAVGNQSGWGYGGGIYNHSTSIAMSDSTFAGNSVDSLVGYGGAVYNSFSTSGTISACTFTGNLASQRGGAVSNDSSSPALSYCVFSGNVSRSGTGGAVDNYIASPMLSNCTFAANSSDQDGGGIFNYSSSPTLTNCTFDGNSASRGGGIFNSLSCSPALANCVFSRNSADFGGGMVVSSSSNAPTLSNCTFTANTATYGGGAIDLPSCSPSMLVVNCIFAGNSAGPFSQSFGGGIDIGIASPSFVNCAFIGNSAAYGGGVYNQSASPSLINCTFVGNTATTQGSAVENRISSAPTVVNCIVWGNSSSGGQPLYDNSSTSTVSYSDIQGGFAGTGNIDADPKFIRNPSPGPDGAWGTADDEYGDLRVRPGSPAIDAGNNSAVPSGILLDAAGNARFLDIPSISDTGSGTAPIVDMGAYEAFIWPAFAPIADATVNESDSLNFTATNIETTIPDSSIRFDFVGAAPAGASLTPQGLFSWSPSEAQGPGVYPISVRVSMIGDPDVCDTRTFTVTVNEVNQAPVLAAIDDMTVKEGDMATFTASASDADLPANVLTYGLGEGAPAGASIDPSTGVFTWTPTEAQGPGVYAITVIVTDNGSPSLADARTFTVTVQEVNEAPVLAVIPDKTLNEGELLSFAATATDSDLPSNALTYSLAPGAPAGARIDPVTGLFTWRPSEAQGPGTYELTVYVSDDGSPSLYDTTTFTVTVVEVNQAPVLGGIADQMVNEGSTLNFTALAVDPDIPVQVLTFSLDDAPAGASIDPVTGAFTFTATDGPASYSVTLRVNDGFLSDTTTFCVTVNNIAPSLSTVATQAKVIINNDYTLGLSATNLGPDAISFWTIDWGDSVEQVTGSPASVTHQYSTPGRYIVTATASDKDGTYSAPQHWGVTAVLPTAAVSGTLFNDRNGNGQRDASEPALAGWTLFLDADKDGVRDSTEPAAVTDSLGRYSFSGVAPGSYRLSWQTPSGWKALAIAAPAADLAMKAGDQFTSRNFAFYQPATISGVLFNDLAGSGIFNQSPALPGRQVFIDANHNGKLDTGEKSAITDAYGRYSFKDLAPGTYRVAAVAPAGWRTSSPAAGFCDVAILGNQTLAASFGQTQKALIAGNVWYDAKSNGVKDAGDWALFGWRVYIDLDKDGVFDANEPNVLSDRQGNYSFSTLSAGTYMVRVAPFKGYRTTSPKAGGYTLPLNAGQVIGLVNFGIGTAPTH